MGMHCNAPLCAKHTLHKVNCAAVPADLLESELFGYEAGAFTGATHPKPGKFELCNKGTILLAEIGEMPPSLQPRLLHLLHAPQSPPTPPPPPPKPNIPPLA